MKNILILFILVFLCVQENYGQEIIDIEKEVKNFGGEIARSYGTTLSCVDLDEVRISDVGNIKLVGSFSLPSEPYITGTYQSHKNYNRTSGDLISSIRHDIEKTYNYKYSIKHGIKKGVNSSFKIIIPNSAEFGTVFSSEIVVDDTNERSFSKRESQEVTKTFTVKPQKSVYATYTSIESNYSTIPFNIPLKLDGNVSLTFNDKIDITIGPKDQHSFSNWWRNYKDVQAYSWSHPFSMPTRELYEKAYSSSSQKSSKIWKFPITNILSDRNILTNDGYFIVNGSISLIKREIIMDLKEEDL